MHPYAKKVLIPELGKDAWMLLENPWNLPQEQPLPAKFFPGKDDDGNPKPLPPELIDEYNQEVERRARRKLALQVLEWHGINDAETGEPMPLPKDDPTVYDRLGKVVTIKLAQANSLIQLDEEWDPTRRPEPPQEKPEPQSSKGSTTSPKMSSDQPAEK